MKVSSDTRHMEDLRVLKQDAFTWFEKRPPIHWSRAFFEDNSKCDILLNNFNAVYHRDEESDDSDEDDDEVEDDEEFEDGVHYCFDPTDPDGHKLVFHNSHRQSYMFDPRERIWVPVDWPNRSKQTAKCVDGKLLCYYGDMIDIWTSNGMQTGVEHEGFLIAQLRGGDGLAAFRWGLDGVPKLYRVLDELDPIFRTDGKLLINSNYLSNAMGKCDGGRMCWAASGEHHGFLTTKLDPSLLKAVVSSLTS
ncbi:hypothetical protein ACLB2K_027275 [Fragaria x ananassa]